MLVIEPERRFSIDAIVNHPWTVKNTSPLTKLIIDQILHIKDPRAGWLVNESTVDSIVRTVGVPRESVIDSVRKNKCDDISALYHMIEYNLRDLEREMLQAVVTMLPPSSPTSKSPFFNMQSGVATTSEATAGGSAAGHKTVTEVYNNVDLASAFMGKCTFFEEKKYSYTFKIILFFFKIQVTAVWRGMTGRWPPGGIPSAPDSLCRNTSHLHVHI